jgi:N-acylneuraminate cytidylyltransferase
MKIIIPARGASKRIPNKNTVMINKRPMISYSIEESLKVTPDVYVSTDCNSIADISRIWGAKIIQRPQELSTDFSTTDSVVEHFLDTIDNINYFACVQPTSPLLTSFYLKKGFDKIKERCYDSIISVNKSTNFFWNSSGQPINFERNKKPRTQDMENWYAENGAFYITSREDFLVANKLVNGEVGFVMMPKIISFEIDDYEDLEIVRSILKYRQTEGV